MLKFLDSAWHVLSAIRIWAPVCHHPASAMQASSALASSNHIDGCAAAAQVQGPAYAWLTPSVPLPEPPAGPPGPASDASPGPAAACVIHHKFVCLASHWNEPQRPEVGFLLLSTMWTAIVFLMGVCIGRRTRLTQHSPALARASDAPSSAPVAHSSDRCPDAVKSVKVPWVHFGASLLPEPAASCIETPPGSELEFDEELCFTKHRGVRMTVDEAYLEVLAEAQWRLENGPGAAYTASEAEYYDELCRAGEEPVSPATGGL